MATPYACIHLTEVDSTQDEARRRHTGTPQLVVADRQNHGRGRVGRHWDSAPRALALSLAFMPAWPPATWPRLTLVAGLAALDALPADLDMSWPNDLLKGGRKAGGILVEASGQVVVVGLGVNLWWPDPPEDRVGLYPRDPGPDAALGLAEAWTELFLDRMEADPDAWGREEAEARCVTIGEHVVVEDGRRGRAIGIDAEGALIVEAGGQRWSVRSGPVEVAGEPPTGQ